MGFFQNLTGWHALILLAVVLLLFGAAKLPALARSMGQSMKIFRAEVKDQDATPADVPTTTAAMPTTASTASATTAAPREVVPLTERSVSS
jgi:sec-independent protein translocase protein TatA